VSTFTINTTEIGGRLDSPTSPKDAVKGSHGSPCNQVDLAAELADRLKEDVRYNPDAHQWLTWNAGWQVDETNCAMYEHITQQLQGIVNREQTGTPEQVRQAKKWQIFVSTHLSHRGLKDMAAMLQLQNRLVARGSSIDANPDLLGTPSGVIELDTGNYRAARREDLVTRRTTIDPAIAADCPRWKQFLAETISNDPEVLSYLQQVIGYCLTGHTSIEQMWILVGSGSNGKSTFLRTLQAVMGKYATTAAETVLLRTGQGSGANNDVAALKGARLVTLAETDQNRALNEAKLKQLVSGDVVSARLLFSNFSDFRPTGKLFLATNHLPRVVGTDNGIWRRLVVVPFNRQFDKDPSLEGALNAELGAILAWAVEGATHWYSNGRLLPVPSALANPTQQYRQQEDHIGRFITECLRDAQGNHLPAEDLRAAYTRWCTDEGVTARDQNAIGARMTQKGWSTKRHGKKRRSHWVGVELVQTSGDQQEVDRTPDGQSIEIGSGAEERPIDHT